jgi:hypothetical protein
MIEAGERKKMLAVCLCGERVLLRLESIGVERLADLRGRDPWQVMHEINLRARRPIWQPPIAIAALQNLIDAAGQEHTQRRPR